MTKSLIFILGLCITILTCFGQSTKEVHVPTFADKYSQFVKQLESGQIEINYREFRESFIESEQFKIAARKSNVFDSLKNKMYALMDTKNYPEIINVTKEMLSINYTSMLAHKILRQTYSIVGDTINATKYKSIQFGLLNSIVKSGNGKTCASAWSVVQISEEYFILDMLGVELLKQSTDNSGGVCDKMEVKTEEGDRKIYYFETSKVFEGYKKLGMK